MRSSRDYVRYLHNSLLKNKIVAMRFSFLDTPSGECLVCETPTRMCWLEVGAEWCTESLLCKSSSSSPPPSQTFSSLRCYDSLYAPTCGHVGYETLLSSPPRFAFGSATQRKTHSTLIRYYIPRVNLRGNHNTSKTEHHTCWKCSQGSPADA